MCGIGRPFAIGDTPVIVEKEAVLLVALRELLQASFGLVDCVDPLLCFGKARLEGAREWLKPRV